HHRDTASAAAPAQDASLKAATQAVQTIEGKPIRIVIPGVNIDVGVADGIYNPRTQSWTLSTNKAHYALMTPEPNNQGGNTFIYGHNRREVFNRLGKLAVGQMVYIYTDNNHFFTYKY